MRSLSTNPRIFRNFLYCALFMLIASVMIVSCNNETPANKTPDSGPQYWIVLNVQFKPETTPVVKDASLKLIQHYLLGRVEALKKENPDFEPAIWIGSNMMGDPDLYQIRISSGNITPHPKSLAIMSSKPVPPPNCICPAPCTFCDSLFNYRFYDPLANIPGLLRSTSDSTLLKSMGSLRDHIVSLSTADEAKEK